METMNGRVMSITRVQLPTEDGVDHWAEIRTVESLRAGDAKAVRRAIVMETDENGHRRFGLGVADDMRDALLARIITAWSYDLPIPAGDTASLDEISLEAYNELIKVSEPHWSRVDFTPDKGSQTRNSSGSRPSSTTNGSHPGSSHLPAASTH